MNALVSIDVATLTPATVFAPGGVEGILSKIETEVSAEVFTLDTAEGRERIKSVAYKVARSKTALDDMGKELVSGIKAQAAAIDADRRTIRDRLDALKERVRGPLTAWEDAEAVRVNSHENAIVFIMAGARFAEPPAVATIRSRIDAIQPYVSRDWQEFKERGDTATAEALQALGTMLAAAEQAERDAAELAELRRLKAERDWADRIAAAVAQAAEKARQEAEQKAARDAAEAERVAEWQRQREEQAERDVQATVARALENDRRRQEAERVRVAAEKAKADLPERKRHRAKIEGEVRSALIGLGFEEQAADVILRAITGDLIPHVSITY